jgi:hypothetical protein
MPYIQHMILIMVSDDWQKMNFTIVEGRTYGIRIYIEDNLGAIPPSSFLLHTQKIPN